MLAEDVRACVWSSDVTESVLAERSCVILSITNHDVIIVRVCVCAMIARREGVKMSWVVA